MQFRSVLKSFVAIEQEEGVGAHVRRSIGSMKQRNFSPFLLMDNFTVSHPAGFPDHPHHGQETITYVLKGMIAHEDFTGSRGVLRPGDLQFMTAGKAIMHSEIPVQMNNGDAGIGIQLWVDLPKKLKNCEPRYRNLRATEIPIVKPNDDLTVRVVSGKSYGVESVKDLAYTPIDYYFMNTKKTGTEFVQEFPADFNVFLYIIKGSVKINDTVHPQYSTIFFKTDGDAIKGCSASEDTEFVLVGGQILDQPIIQHGPFVESDRESLLEVFKNYQYCINGFERARGWRSRIADGIHEDDVEAFEKSNPE